jgi:hypothetical protein
MSPAVARTGAHPEILRRTGQVLTLGELAREYDFTDADGRQPPPFQLPGE